ncbi:MAG TPA: PKD domain-containing protein, partial [Flavobacteriales bacterium]|nr:PKD domain-containing protein [Flavobacteriales bacterium]
GFDATTAIRAESPIINTTGKFGITIDFNYIENGEGAVDNAQLWYNDGSGWTFLVDLPKTALCGAQGLWTNFNTTLPASCDNNPNVQIGFTWDNDNNAAGTDPSFAVDDITLDAPTSSPTACFTFSPASPCVGATVSFTDCSSGGTTPYTYAWTFTGGTPATSTAANPTCTFAAAGPHNVTLIVTDALGNDDTVTQVVNVVTCASPTASFTFSPASPCVGATVTFTNTSGGGSPPLSYAWTFAGGTPATSTATNPTCTFAAAGPHNVTLIVTDALGNDDTVTQVVNVVACTAPVASFSFTPNPVCAGLLASFTNTSTGGPFTSASWTFIGGTPATSTSTTTATTTWAAPGSYTVTLIVNTATSADTVTQVVTVVNCSTPPVANFAPSSNPVCNGSCINFTNMSSSTTGTFTSSWTFTGATPASSTATNPTNVCYSAIGSYQVTLIVTDALGSDTAVQNINVINCPPVAGFTFTGNDTVCAGSCIAFTDTSTNVPTTWSWSFPGSATPTSTLPNPPPICYFNPGTYPVTLTVTNAAGTDSHTQIFTVIDCSPPNAAFTVDDVNICLGQCVTVNNTTISASPATYVWYAPYSSTDTVNFGEPGQFCYPDTAGLFTITMIAYNPYGSDTATQFIIVDTLPIIEAFPDEITISLGDSLDMWVVANNPDVDYLWTSTDTNSLDGVDSSLYMINVTPTYPDTTYYYVYVTGSNGCANVDSVIVYVELVDVVMLPNAFSPNNDGFNDFLRVLGPGIVKMDLVVYNRYGQLVFHGTEQEKGWDGTMKGKPLDTGVFAWYLTYELENGLKGVQKGNVTLIR